MKFNYFKKAVSLALAVSLTVTLLSACGKSSDTATSSSVAPSSTSTVAVNKDPLGKYATPIDITFVRGIDDDLAANILPKTPGETLEDNRWTRLYKEELGINVKYAWTVKGNESSDAYVQKINVTLHYFCSWHRR